jgi:predicted NUDIX family phosphoesterase
MNEDVMVVETAVLRPHFTGRLIRDGSAILHLIDAHHRFIPRPIAEVSLQYRQIIPYVVIRHADDYFVLKRTSKQTEARLHHKLSLGVGGHINPGHSVMEGLRKELGEEVRIDAPYQLQFAGILNDESTEVARVHLGVAYLLDVSQKSVEVIETEKMSGDWMSRSAMRGARSAMESWSEIIYDEFIA